MLLRCVGCFSLLLVLSGRAQQPFELDQSFQTTIGSQNISSLIPLEDGKVLVAGRFDYPGATVQLKMGRLEDTGAWDQTYAANGYGGGKLTAWEGRFYVQSTTIVRRVLYDGAIDPTFIGMNTGPYFQGLQSGDYHVFPDGRLLFCGDHLLSDTLRGFVGHYNLSWFTNEGKLDTTRIHRKCDGFIYRVFPLPDGKFLLSGNWSEYDGIATPNSTHLIRIFGDGSLDTTFQAPLDFGRPAAHLLLPNGRHLIMGIFGFTNENDTLQIARLLPDGGLDSTFNWHHQFLYAYGNDVAFADITTALPMGGPRFIITGAYTSIDGQPRGGIAMIDTSGQLVNDYFSMAGCGPWNDGFQDRGYITGITPTPDSSSYYIYGSYHGYNDGTANDAGQRMVSRLYGLDVGVVEEEQEQVNIWPNPSGGIVHIELPPVWKYATVTISDAMGRVIIRDKSTVNTFVFDAGLFAPGIYVISVITATGDRLTTKWVRP